MIYTNDKYLSTIGRSIIINALFSSHSSSLSYGSWVVNNIVIVFHLSQLLNRWHWKKKKRQIIHRKINVISYWFHWQKPQVLKGIKMTITLTRKNNKLVRLELYYHCICTCVFMAFNKCKHSISNDFLFLECWNRKKKEHTRESELHSIKKTHTINEYFFFYD